KSGRDRDAAQLASITVANLPSSAKQRNALSWGDATICTQSAKIVTKPASLCHIVEESWSQNENVAENSILYGSGDSRVNQATDASVAAGVRLLDSNQAAITLQSRSCWCTTRLR